MKKGVPAVVIVTEQFEALAKTVMKSQNVPDSVAVMIKGNPELVSDDELMKVADRVLVDVVERLTRYVGADA